MRDGTRRRFGSNTGLRIGWVRRRVRRVQRMDLTSWLIPRAESRLPNPGWLFGAARYNIGAAAHVGHSGAIAMGRNAGRAGQALTEFVLVVASTLLLLVMVALFLHTFREYGGRVLNLVASEYP